MSDHAKTNGTAGTRLRAGDRLASQTIRAFVCADAMGERYETVFGSTTHALDVCVPPAGAAFPSATDYAAFVSRVSRVRHPCVVRCFASGEGAPREGAKPVPWLRCEHQDGVAASVLETPVDPAGLPADDDGPLVPTFGALLAASGGRLSPNDRDALLGDVLDGLAHLHSLGLPCGHLAPDEIALGRVRHRMAPRARIRIYAWPPDSGPADLSADLVLAASLFRAALDASAAVSKPREAEALAAFAENLGSGAFASAAAAAAEFSSLCARWGRPRAAADDADGADGGNDDETTRPAATGRADAAPRRRHRKPTSSGSSEVARRLMSLVRIFAVIAFIVGVGVAVYFYLSASAEEERRRVAALSGETKPAILVIPTERTSEALLAELPDSVFDFTPEQLALAAGAAGDPRAPLAAVRAALESLDATGSSVSAAAFADASSAVSAVLPALREAAASDPAAELLLGRAMLLGLGTPVDAARGYGHVLQASLDGLHEADLVFGDLLASGVKVPDLRAESRMERDRRAVASWRRAAGPDFAPSPQFGRAVARIAPMLRAGRGIPPMNNDYPQWLGRAAAAGHVPALVALSTPGGFASADPAEALKFLRLLARARNADPARRAWAQCRMAGMFERGEGTPAPDVKAALLWYRRAAEGGNRGAMEALDRLLRKGTTAERAEAAKWRRLAEAAGPEPAFPLVSSLVEPPSVRHGAPVESVSSARAFQAANAWADFGAASASKPGGGGSNRAAAPPAPRRPAPAAPAADAPLVPLTEERSDEPENPAPEKAAPGKSGSAKPAAGKKAAWPPKGARVDPVRKKDSAK